MFILSNGRQALSPLFFSFRKGDRLVCALCINDVHDDFDVDDYDDDVDHGEV